MSTLQDQVPRTQSSLFVLAAGVKPTVSIMPSNQANFKRGNAIAINSLPRARITTSMAMQKGNNGDQIVTASDIPQQSNVIQSVGEKFQRMSDGFKAQEQPYLQLAGAGPQIPVDSSLGQNMMMFKQLQGQKPGNFGAMRPQVGRSQPLKAMSVGAASMEEEGNQTFGDIFNTIKKSFLDIDGWKKTMDSGLKIEINEFMQETTIEGDVKKKLQSEAVALEADNAAMKAQLNSSVMESRSSNMDDMLVDRPQATAKIANVLENGKPPMNTYRPKEPLTTKVVFNKLITQEGAGDVNHIAFDHEGELPYAEGQSIGVLAKGLDKNGKPHKLRLYSIASSAPGDFGDGKTVSLCVKRLIYDDPESGKEVKGVCSNYICDLKAGDEVEITGPVGQALLLPKDPEATVIMLATGTGIAPFRSFMWRFFLEQHPEYKFNGKAWLFMGVPTTSALLYDDEFKKMKEIAGDKFQYDYAISREATDKNGNKMYIQNKMAEYGEELWDLMQKPNTYVYMCGLKGMESGIQEALGGFASENGVEWADFVKSMKKEGRYHVEVY